MNKQKKGRKFGRVRKVRKAFIKSLIVNVVRYEKIRTTEARAKELRPLVERLVTKARTGTLANRKIVIAKTGPATAKKLFEKIAPKYKGRNGGYTRIIKMPARKGDAAKMAMIEFV